MTVPDDAGLARERTLLAWTRTALSFCVAGAVLLRLLGPAAGGVIWLAAVFVAIGAVAWLWGWLTPEVRPAVESRAGRAAVRVLALGTAAVALVAVAGEVAG